MNTNYYNADYYTLYQKYKEATYRLTLKQFVRSLFLDKQKDDLYVEFYSNIV